MQWTVDLRPMIERDQARRNLKLTAGDRMVAMKKYKNLRNKVTKQIREENKQANGKRIDEANTESEYWNVVNGIIKPQSEPKWKLVEDDIVTENDEEVAIKCNVFFVNKIEVLKSNFDVNLKEDPLVHLAKKVEHKNQKFSLKTVTAKAVIKVMKKMKKEECWLGWCDSGMSLEWHGSLG